MTRITVFHPCYALIAASALLLAGCGATSGQKSAPASSPTPALASSSLNDVPTSTTATPCGTVPSAHGAQANVVIRAGAVDCPQATRVITQYLPEAFAQ